MPDVYSKALRVAAVRGRLPDPALMQAAEPDVDWDDFITAGANRAIFDFVDDSWRFAHDKLRETLLNDLGADEQFRL